MPISLNDSLSLERRTVRKVILRLIPFMILLYLFNYLDRINVSFAKFQMSKDLGFSETVYGTGAGIFFIGYFLFEVPSNLIMQKVGARLWMARIMITWGIISACMMFVKSATAFYTLRLLLGIAEAGFFPGMLLYMTYWIPAEQRAKASSWFLLSTALSGVVGGPIADQLMALNAFGLHGWQWLFLLEGIPSVLLGCVILFFLDDGPERAKWLRADEKAVLGRKLASDRAGLVHAPHHITAAFFDRRVWLLCLLYGTVIYGYYMVNFFTPSIIKDSILDKNTPIGFLTAIPFFAAMLTMMFVGWYADGGERPRRVVGVLSIIACAGFLLAASTDNTVLLLISLSIAASGAFSTLGPFWALPSRFLRGSAVAAAIGLINSFGNLGGFICPKITGSLKDAQGNYHQALMICAGVSAFAAVLAFTTVKNLRAPAVPSLSEKPIPRAETADSVA